MEYRKNAGRILAGILTVVMLLSSVPSAVYAVGGESGIVAVTGQETVDEEGDLTESDTGAKGQEETEAPGEDSGEKETGETSKEDVGAEAGDAGETADRDETPGDDGEESGAGKSGTEDAVEENEETESDSAQEEEVEEDTLQEQTNTAAVDATVDEGAAASGSCGENVTWQFADGVLTISGSGAMEDYQSPHDVKGKSAPWYKYHRNNIKRVVVEEGVTTIGGYAFYVCHNFTSIELASSITTIGEFAFEECGGLTSIELPSGVTAIRESAFNNCWRLTSIELPSGVTIIEAGTFEWCQSLTDIELPSGVTSIGKDAFRHCSSLTDIELPSGVTAIGEYAFSGCSNLTNIKLPSGVTTIEAGTFSTCHGLLGIELPSGITAIGANAFYACDSLTSIELPLGVTSIGKNAFWSCDRLASIVLSIGVTAIGESAFAECRSLTDVYYGGSESDWRAIRIGDYNEPLTSATIHYNSLSSDDGGGSADPQKEYKIYWGSGYESFDISLEDCIAKTSSTIYNPQLAHMLIAMCNSVYSEANIRSTFNDFGFQSEDIDNSQDGIYLTYGMAKKQVGDQTLVLVVARGTEKIISMESASNIFGSGLNSEGQHSGFADAAKGLRERLQTRLGITNFQDAVFVITGFSRGAAAANILSAQLMDEGAQQHNVFTYTFACPDIGTAALNNSYESIFNVSDAKDFVSWTPSGWMPGFIWEKYGRSYWYCENWDDYETLEMGMNAHNQSKYLEYLRQEQSMREFRTRSVTKTKLDEAKSWRNNKFWNEVKNNFLTFIGIHCPVDIEIYASDGRLVGNVKNNLVSSVDTDKVFISVVDAEKDIYLLDDDTYTFKLNATGGGTMTYIVQNMDAKTRDIIGEQNYENVTLTTGKKFTSEVVVKNNIAVDVDMKEVKLYVIDDNGNPEKEVLPDGAGTEIPYTDPNEVLPEDIPADGKIPDGLWIAGVADSYTYTGAVIKPEIRVYDGKKKLRFGKDYTVSYKNNTKVNDAAVISTAPTIAVKGKGNYAGSETATFKITPVSLSGDSVTVEDITVACNKKVQKKVPIVTYNGRKLARNKDFTVSYPDGGTGAYKEAGTYDILLTAKTGGNFSGTKTVKCIITDSVLLGKVNVRKIPNQTYTGTAIEPELTVTYKNAPLVKGTDYTVSYTDHTEIGTAQAVLTGIGKYAGTKKVTFRITGISLKGAAVSGIGNRAYNGNFQEHSLTVAQNGRTLTAGTDYDVVYADNRDVGKASVTIKGKGAYTGSIKKTFRIEKFDIAANMDDRFVVEVKQETVPYAKDGAKPKVVVSFRTGNGGWRTLTEGTDYTLSCRNHKAVNDGSRADRQPAVIVKGKGNFGGVYGEELHYKIEAQDLGRLTLTAQDRTYRNKRNSFATKLTIMDLDGKCLQPGTDYQKVFACFYTEETAVDTAGGGTVVRAAGDAVDKDDIIPARTVLKVRVTAAEGGNYTGTLEGTYRIVQADIASASVSVQKQIYTGQPVTLEKNQLTVKVKGKELDDSQYEIVPGSYKNNVHKGTASVTVRGVNNYGGTKTVRFTIRPKGFFWWWR